MKWQFWNISNWPTKCCRFSSLVASFPPFSLFFSRRFIGLFFIFRFKLKKRKFKSNFYLFFKIIIFLVFKFEIIRNLPDFDLRFISMKFDSGEKRGFHLFFSLYASLSIPTRPSKWKVHRFAFALLILNRMHSTLWTKHKLVPSGFLTKGICCSRS